MPTILDSNKSAGKLDRWEIHPSVRSKNIDIVLRGERKKGIWQIDVSVFEEAEQLSFFDK